MLAYSFSRREKVLLVILAILLIGVVWYTVVFRSANEQITAINAQISEVQNQTVADTAKIQQMDSMRQSIDSWKAQGGKGAVLPAYDNVQGVMLELNSVLSSTKSYSVSFDDLDRSGQGYVKRGVTMNFTTAGYDEARNVIAALESGAYPCSVDSVSISANGVSKASAAPTTSSVGSSGFTSTVHAVFFERVS